MIIQNILQINNNYFMGLLHQIQTYTTLLLLVPIG